MTVASLKEKLSELGLATDGKFGKKLWSADAHKMLKKRYMFRVSLMKLTKPINLEEEHFVSYFIEAEKRVSYQNNGSRKLFGTIALKFSSLRKKESV